MRKLLFFSSLLLGISTLVSCQSATTEEGKGIPVDVVFEKWNIQFGMVHSIDVTLKGRNKSGAEVAVQTKLGINQYDEYLLPMLTKLEEEDQFKDGNTGSGKLEINQEFGNGKLFIEKVGNIPTTNMEFVLNEEVVSMFTQ